MKRRALLLLFILAGIAAQAQTAPPFYNEVKRFKSRDSVQAPAPGGIVLIGSSSFTKWKDVATYFPGYRITNNAFGGSTIPDVIRYFYEVVMPYKPDQVVIYCGENDVASSDTVSAATVALRLQTLFQMIRTNYPEANISFVSLKPSPSRARMQDRVKEANRLIKNFLAHQTNANFIDIYDAMLDSKGAMRPELFVNDMLHMKPEGYRIWQKIMQPYLLR